MGGCSTFLKRTSGGAVKCFLMDCQSVGIKYNITTDENGNQAIALSEKTAEEKKLDKNSVLEGIGASKLYLPLSKAIVDGAFTAPDSLAFEMMQWCQRNEGCGGRGFFFFFF